jgi:hypothetical protein
MDPINEGRFLDTAFDFRGRLRFPRVTREPPRRWRSCGVSH